MSLLCRLRSGYYSLRYWLSGGDLRFSVDGHEYGEPVYEIREQKSWDKVATEAYVARVENERLTCSRCGHISDAWRPLP